MIFSKPVKNNVNQGRALNNIDTIQVQSEMQQGHTIAPQLQVYENDGETILNAKGDFVLSNLLGVLENAKEIENFLATQGKCVNAIDVRQLGEIDTAGTYLISRILCNNEKEKIGRANKLIGSHEAFSRLNHEISRFSQEEFVQPPREGIIELLGRRVSEAIKFAWEEMVDSTNFLGSTIYCLIKSALNPGKVRWLQTFAVAESAGFNAIPIIMVLTFFIGAVVTFMGARTLQTFGATIFTVDLLGISILREFAILITAILLAGRSDSAFTAQIGSMRMNQEIDAMNIIGLDPMEVLVVPRVLALLIMMPILVFFAMIAGIFGGLVVSLLTLDINMTLFFSRLQQHVGEQHFWVGMAKAPIIAIIIAIIGCRKGLAVENDVISLGKNTTSSVVQAIFSVIIIDAIFALIFNELEI